jgi:hypothetical protein
MRATSLLLALRSVGASYSFVTWGDWGTGSALQKDNAAQINAWCQAPGACSMVVGLADNFYVRVLPPAA